jgi:hypothetical protein
MRGTRVGPCCAKLRGSEHAGSSLNSSPHATPHTSECNLSIVPCVPPGRQKSIAIRRSYRLRIMCAALRFLEARPHRHFCGRWTSVPQMTNDSLHIWGKSHSRLHTLVSMKIHYFGDLRRGKQAVCLVEWSLLNWSLYFPYIVTAHWRGDKGWCIVRQTWKSWLWMALHYGYVKVTAFPFFFPDLKECYIGNDTVQQLPTTKTRERSRCETNPLCATDWEPLHL